MSESSQPTQVEPTNLPQNSSGGGETVAATSPPLSPVPPASVSDCAYERLRAMSMQLLNSRNRKLLMDYLQLRQSLRTPDHDV